MVWLHGGGLRTGSGNATFYDGTNSPANTTSSS